MPHLALRRWAVASAIASAAPAAAAAEPWLWRLDLPAAIAIAEPPRDRFGLGALPAISVARALSPRLLLGLHLRGGALRDGPAPRDPALRDPGAGGWLGALAAARVRPGADHDPSRAVGPWLELAGGFGVTGGIVRPAFEIGLGLGLPAGAVTWGPTFRYLQVVQPDGALDGRDARLGLVGVEITFRDTHRTRAAGQTDRDRDGLVDAADRCPEAAEDRDRFEDGDGCPDPDGGRDRLVDAMAACAAEPAPPADGCGEVDDADAAAGAVALGEDRIVLDEAVLFGRGEARVRAAGRRALAGVVALWRANGDWDRLVVEGHADARGAPAFNDALSALRALRVKEALVAQGAPAAQIDVRGYGSSRPRGPGDDEESLRRNRRVEIVVLRRPPGNPPVGVAAGAPDARGEGVADEEQLDEEGTP